MIFIFDENFSPRLAEGLNHLEAGNEGDSEIIKVTHIIALYGGRGAPDETVIEIAGQQDGVIFTQDTDFKRIKHYYQLYKKHNVGVVFYKSTKKGGGYWNMVGTVISRWNELKTEILKTSKPFAFSISKNGISQHHF